ncbi:SDR family oxidoreductase [Pseudomonas citronellolis]|uniref:SDR family oxidoreductase n=1 Tax=Pseudomonas citronellolis TaxID=53408 RepID=UPI0021BEAF5B|nr:SDR family oxidoreductase [Pseudomonas citronellolis]UXJ50287.1 SDR family oxidoreductase [Pseudomonas citronellolis]
MTPSDSKRDTKRARTVAVTGSASGIGAATCTLLRKRGWRVIGIDRHHADIEADLATRQGCDAMVTAIRTRYGDALDAVIACAGTSQASDLALRVNFFGASRTLEGLRPLLSAGNAPRAVLVSSAAALHPHDALTVTTCLDGDEAGAIARLEKVPSEQLYATSKVAITAWMRREAVRPEWAECGVLLNAIAPGVIETPMTADLLASSEGRAQLDRLVPRPIGRNGQPEEVAELLAFLASPQNSYMVGQLIFVDGGTEALTRSTDRDLRISQ